MPSLFSPLVLGLIEAPNRVFMAPMTRNRAGADGVPTDLNVAYYAQRAGAGLVITEATQPVPEGQSTPHTPGLHTDAQQDGWARVADAVHAEGGRLVIQLMHAGRISHPSLQPGGAAPVGPSAVRPAGETFTDAGLQPFVIPRALSTDEVAAIPGQFADAARRAIAAGADGVEVHGANGFLLHQFLSADANRRDDRYGGAPANRIRLTVETAAAVAEAVGSGRVGVRISPGNPFNDMFEPDLFEVYPALVHALDNLRLAYLHVVEAPAAAAFSAIDLARTRWRGALVGNSGGAAWGAREAQTLLDRGRADAVAFGRAFLANPDLPARLRDGAELNEPDEETFYGGDGRGYTDYPVLAAAAA